MSSYGTRLLPVRAMLVNIIFVGPIMRNKSNKLLFKKKSDISGKSIKIDKYVIKLISSSSWKFSKIETLKIF